MRCAVVAAIVALSSGCTKPARTSDVQPSASAASNASAETGPPPQPTAVVSPGCPNEAGVTRSVVVDPASGGAIRMSIILSAPPQDSQGVLYLLHGAGTDESQWEAIGVQAALDDLVSSGRGRPVVVVLPDLPTGADLSANEAALLEAVVPTVDTCDLGPPSARRRAIGGISRGGQLALTVATDHPDLFTAVGAHSPAISAADSDVLAQGLKRGGLDVWLDVGSEDGLANATTALAHALEDLGAPVDFQASAGGHDRSYWSAHVPDYLQWYSDRLGSAS
jgi:enterochelin esterase-like enzyme